MAVALFPLLMIGSLLAVGLSFANESLHEDRWTLNERHAAEHAAANATADDVALAA